MQAISRVRFEALAAYCRNLGALIAAQEVRWLQAHDEAILVVVIRDVEDGDYSAILLAQDLRARYRWVEATPFFATADEAQVAALEAVARVYADFDGKRVQGDDKGKPVDFFTPVVDGGKLNPDFATISSLEGYSPAVELIKPMMRWYEDADGNFVEQFQTTGFDARLWELYLFAALVESGYVFEKKYPMPDYCAKSVYGDLCIEATTVNPSRSNTGELVPPPPLDTEEQILDFQRQYMPIRYAGPLTAKLAKTYWEKEHVKGRSLAFAIQDFHAPSSMVTSRSALPVYLYGTVWDWEKNADGKLIIKPKKIQQHVWETKTAPSGFFTLPGAEHISAVIANASATISKFNRMGVLAGFGSKRVQLVRVGTAANPDPNSEQPATFVHYVNSSDYRETWIEGMDVFHNPNALHPLNPAMLPGAAHHWLREDGQLSSHVPEWQPFGSVTHIHLDE